MNEKHPFRPNEKGNDMLRSTMKLATLVALTLSTVGLAPYAAQQQREVLPTVDLTAAQVTFENGEKGDPKIDSRLWQLERLVAERGWDATTMRFAQANRIARTDDGQVRVLIHQSAAPNYLAGPRAASTAQPEEEAIFAAMQLPIDARVRTLGGTPGGRTKNLVEAAIPATALGTLARTGEIGWIEPVPQPHVLQIESQGVRVTRARALLDSTASYGPAQRTVRVGVLDVGFLGFEELRGIELPANVTTRSFHSGGITAFGDSPSGRVHGTAVAEIVHDMAPDAELYLVNFDPSPVAHAQAVSWLISQQVDVISYSIGWWNLLGPGDGRGPINDDVRRALAAGIAWVGAAGNAAQEHWQGPFMDLDGDRIHNFGSIDETNSVQLAAGESLTVSLRWNDGFASNQDYDLFILDANLNVVAASINAQTGSQPPLEVAGVVALAPTTAHIVTTRFRADRNVELEMFRLQGSPRLMQYRVPAGSLEIPADTDGALAVGATLWSSDDLETFSSRGPTTDGRTKPDLSAPDGVDTVAYGLLFGVPFSGTSAATPHVSGAIALMKSRFGVYSLDQVVEILAARAIDKGPVGEDNLFGSGRLDIVGR